MILIHNKSYTKTEQFRCILKSFVFTFIFVLNMIFYINRNLLKVKSVFLYYELVK